jgi:hypothetical protein
MDTAEGEPFLLRVQLLSCQSMELDLTKIKGGARDQTRVEDVKAAICQCRGYAFEQLGLVFRAKLLENSRPLCHYGITHGASLQIVLRLISPRYPIASLPSAAEEMVPWSAACAHTSVNQKPLRATKQPC